MIKVNETPSIAVQDRCNITRVKYIFIIEKRKNFERTNFMGRKIFNLVLQNHHLITKLEVNGPC